MDQSKLDSLSHAIKLITTPSNGGSSKPISKILQKITKPSRVKKSDNATVKYFQLISSRRVRSSNKETKPYILESSEKSHYQPFNRKKLYERIATFQRLQNWNLSQEYKQINPLIIASHGWKCDTKRLNTIKCDSCSAEIIIKLSGLKEDEELFESVNNRLISMYLEKLITDHNNSCAWKKQWCSSNVYDIRFENLEEELIEFKESYIENLKYGFDVQNLEIESVLLPDDLIMIQSWLSEEDLRYDGKIVEITLLGWKIIKIDDKLLLSSESDGRRLLITNNNKPLNLLDEHLDWSNYVNGYKVLLKSISVMKEESNESINFQLEDDDNDNNYNDSPITNDNVKISINNTSLESRLNELKNSIL